MNTTYFSKGLGWMSVAMGLAHVLAPRRVARTSGTRREVSEARRRGVRHILTGSGLLRGRTETKNAWPPLGGKAFQGVRLFEGLRKAPRQKRLVSAAGLAMVFALLDFAARRLRDKGRASVQPGTNAVGVEVPQVKPESMPYRPVKRHPRLLFTRRQTLGAGEDQPASVLSKL